MGGGGGGWLSPKLYVHVPAKPQKFYFLYTNFSPNYPPISITFSIEKHLRLSAFLLWFAQNTPNLCNLDSFISDEKPLIAIPNFAKKKKKKKNPPQKADTYSKPCQCENPWGILSEAKCPIVPQCVLIGGVCLGVPVYLYVL